MSIRIAKRVVTAAVAASASGDNTIVAVAAGTKIYVLSYVLVASGAVSAKWKSGSTDLSGAMSLSGNGGVAIAGAFETPLFTVGGTSGGDDLILNLSGATAVNGHVAYIVLPVL